VNYCDATRDDDDDDDDDEGQSTPEEEEVVEFEDGSSSGLSSGSKWSKAKVRINPAGFDVRLSICWCR